MQVVTTVKTTIQEVHKALRLLNPNLPSQFVLEIDYNTESADTEHSQDTTEQQSQPWYPDDSGEWVETYGKKPQNLSDYTSIEVLNRTERYAQDYQPSIYQCHQWNESWSHIVAYKLVKKGN